MANDREQFDAASFLDDFDKEFESSDPVAEAPEEQGDENDLELLPEDSVEGDDDVVEEESEPVSTEEPIEETPEEPKEEPVVTQPEVNDPDIHKRNEAFKKLREEKERLEQSDALLAELAAQYGVSKEELIKRFKDERTKKEAEKQGIPLEQFKRMQELENEVQTIKQKYQQEAFTYEAERLVQKYNIPANQVEEVFKKIGELGLDVVGNPKLLDVAYRALNYEVALQKGRQAQLEETKKRRQTTGSPSLGTKGTTVDTSESDMDAEIDAFLKEKIG
jgi:membrane-bound lytic murein transglycosylase B